MSLLAEIVAQRRARVAQDAARIPVDVVRKQALTPQPSDSWMRIIDPARPVHAVIAEVKRRSPSRGPIAPLLDPARTALAYESAGAAAVSVLTEPDWFGGSFTDLAQVTDAVNIPVLCKDFVVDPYQVWQARAAAADLVLLMVSVLGDSTGEFVRLARGCGLEPLVEIHDEAELETAVASGARLVGINNRDLRTLEVDMTVCRRLLPRLPEHVSAVAESGLSRPEELDDLRALGADAFLIGGALVAAADPAAALRNLLRVTTPT